LSLSACLAVASRRLGLQSRAADSDQVAMLKNSASVRAFFGLMASSYRFGPPRRGGRLGRARMQFGGLVPFAIKWLLITNGVLFVVYFLSTSFGFTPLLALFRALSLIPDWVLHGALWQPVTYLFLHSPYEFGHILINMLMMW